MHVCECVCACMRECLCVCVVSAIVNGPVLPPCAVDGCSRHPLYYYYEVLSDTQELNWSVHYGSCFRFVLQFSQNGCGGGERLTAVLSIVETNPFKHLIHLSLKFVPGTDSDIKKYLADCLKQLKVSC